jgi:RNA polymerase sigma factor (sigma-70 family)
VVETSWAGLRQLLVDRYYDLRERLTRRLGSAELASEALHEVYLRLDRKEPPGVVESPAAYLFKAAYNVANDRRRSEHRHAGHPMADASDIPDEAPRPDNVAMAKDEIAALARALLTLSPRQRAILIAARYEGISRDEIARRYKISRRQVQFELQRALQTCKDYLDEHA